MASVTEQIRDAAEALPPQQQREVLEFVQSLRRKLDDEELAIGEAGRAAAAQILAPEDFSHWEKRRP